MGYGFKMGGRGIILKDPKLELSVESLSISGAEKTKTFSIDWEGDGEPVVTSSDPNIATVSLNGNIVTATFISQGNAIVTVTISQTKHYFSNEIAIPVTCTRSNPLLTLSNSTLNISGASGSGTFTVTYDGDGALSVSSNEIGVATVSISAKTVTVTYKTQGSTTVTVSAAPTIYYNAASATCAVTTTRSNPSFVLNQTTLGIAGATGSGNITVKTNTSGGAISASSSATGVATVSKTNNTTIKVTYINAGFSTVTVTVAQTDFYNAASAKCTVTCTKSNRSLSLSKTSVTISSRSTTATLTITFAGDSQLDYASTNTGVANVSMNKRTTGATSTITYAGKGTCKINYSVPATNKYNAASGSCSVTSNLGLFYVEYYNRESWWGEYDKHDYRNWTTGTFTNPGTTFDSNTTVAVTYSGSYDGGARGPYSGYLRIAAGTGVYAGYAVAELLNSNSSVVGRVYIYTDGSHSTKVSATATAADGATYYGYSDTY